MKNKNHTILHLEFSLLSSILYLWIKYSSKIFCPQCLSSDKIKNGFYKRMWKLYSYSWRIQRYKCKDCKKSYSLYSNTSYVKNKYPPIFYAFIILKIQINISTFFHNALFKKYSHQIEKNSTITSLIPPSLPSEYIESLQFILDNCLNEVQRRLVIGLEVLKIGRGGQKFYHKLTGISIKTIRKGTRELLSKSENIFIGKPLRKSGAGRPNFLDDINFMKNLETLLEDETAGDPMTLLKWTRRSLQKITHNISLMNIKVSCNTVRTILKSMKYSLRVNFKNKSYNKDHPLRNDQFEFIKAQRLDFLNTGYPVLSLDGKKKEMIANFKNPGKTWKLTPYQTFDHEFSNMADGVLTPYGIYDISLNKGWIYAGKNHSTAELAVEALVYWWCNNEQYHNLEKILILCDGGGANSFRSFLWKYTLQELFVDRFGVSVYVSHYPPGNSKWNPIEHKLFSYISINWAGKPLISYETAINYIRSTTTIPGLTVKAHLTDKFFETGKKLNQIEIDTINILNFGPNPDWNYCIKPRTEAIIQKMNTDLENSRKKPPIERKVVVKVDQLELKGGKTSFEWMQHYLTYPIDTLRHDVSDIILNYKPSQFGYGKNKKWSSRIIESVCEQYFNTKSASKSHIHRFLYDIRWKA